MPLASGFRGGQVAVHEPLRADVSVSGGSPLENETLTLPAVTAVPQSSTTVTAKGVGHAAGTLKFVPGWVNTGRSLVGVQPARAACTGVGPPFVEEPVLVAAATTSSRLMELVEPAENVSVIVARSKPAVAPVQEA